MALFVSKFLNWDEIGKSEEENAQLTTKKQGEMKIAFMEINGRTWAELWHHDTTRRYAYTCEDDFIYIIASNESIVSVFDSVHFKKNLE